MDIMEREIIFRDMVFSKVTYPKKMLERFFMYWSEPNRSNKKMRWELQQTWDLNRRLTTWAIRDNNFNRFNNIENKNIDDRPDYTKPGFKLPKEEIADPEEVKKLLEKTTNAIRGAK